MNRWVFIFFFIIVQVPSQNRSSWFTMDNGLPQNSVKDIVKDKYGFIWLSTDNGIVRYDGADFLTYRNLPVNNFHFGGFYGDIQQDNIMVYNGYEENKILIHKRNPKAIKKKDPDTTGRLFYQAGSQWLRTTDNELFSDFNYLVKTVSGDYIISHRTVTYTNHKTQKKLLLSLGKSDTYTIFLHNDTLYITDPKNRKIHRIFRGNIISGKTPPLFNDPNTKIYWQQLTDQTLIVHNDHIYLVDYHRNEPALQLLTHYANFGNYRFRCMLYDDKYSRLYIGSSVKGLNVIQLTQFHTSQKKIPFVDDVSYSSLPFSKNTIIDALGYEYDKHGIVKEHTFGSNEKYYMLYDGDENIMYKRQNMIVRRHKSSGFTTADTILFKGKSFNGLFKSSDLYGISETDFINSSLHLFSDSNLKKAKFSFQYQGIINDFIKFNNNDLLIGSTYGLYVTSLDTGKTVLIKKISVKNIVKTRDGNMWITTNKDGFFLLNGKKLFKMPLDEQHYLGSAHHILDDSSGYYWISSNNGLFKVPKLQLLKSVKNNSRALYYRFTKSDGLLTNEFNGGSVPNAHLLPNKEMVFPSMEGFVFFNPAQVRTYYPEKNTIFIERMKIGGKKITPFHQNIVLENDYKSAEIFIDLPYYADPSNLIIEAQIDNPDQKWEKVESGNQRKYTLRSFDPGKYTLRIRVLLSPNGEYEYQTITFEIKPLFYQTKFFKIVLFLILSLIVILIILKTTKFIRKKNKVLKRTVSHMSIELQETSQNLENAKKRIQKESEYQKNFLEAVNHDITTPVRFIAILAEKLSKEEDTQVQKEYFEGIHQTSEELYKFTLNLKEYNNLYATNQIFEETGLLLNEVLESKQRLFDTIAKKKNNHIEILNKNDIRYFVNKGIIACIIHNIIDNAVKYSSNSTITMSSEQTEENIVLKIADTGNGMTEKQLQYYNAIYQNSDDKKTQAKDSGLGLHMVIHLIKKINAEIHFTKNTPKGTVVEIHLKNKN
jgi:AraC family transcriptional regulator, chitin signaling transcriptional activator